MIDLSLDVSAVPLNPGGAGYYTIAIAQGLSQRDDVSLTLVARRSDGERWHQLTENQATVVTAVPESRPARLAFEQVGFPRLLGKLSVAVHHGPHYTMPERSPVPCVVTIHDCTFFDHPEWHLRSKAAFFRRAITRAATRAGALICVSQVTANRLRENCDVQAPVIVAPHGVDHQRFSPDEPELGIDEAILAESGIPTNRPLVAFVGTLEPRKGIAPLIAAFDRVADTQPDAVLVLGGQVGWGLEAVERALADARHAERIIRTGYLPDAAVPALLRRATVVAYPALEEGFGLPALEALACGATLITTEGTAMAEVAGAAAVLVPPGDVDALAGALDAELTQENLSSVQARQALGVQTAAAYTWEASVALHVDAYGQSLLGSK
ncbi:MAG TPA: glycosyltransferase family 1 protein [Acidimicrobiales bacterium]